MMVRKLSRRPSKRPLRQSPIDLVVCEGETEIDYLSEIKRSLNIHVHICKGDGTDPKSIVKTAKKRKTADGMNYDKIFCVFDRDNNPSAFKESIDLCKQNNFCPIVSNPCFEVWPILHFQFRDSGFGDPQQVMRALRTIPVFAEYEKDGVHVFKSTHMFLD
ncbi:MAG TPA: RloB family protein, partial [Waddliaceae bacterium]